MAVHKIVNTTGKYRDDKSYSNLINYILDPEKTKGKYYGSRAIANCHNAAMEMDILSRAAHKDDGVKLRHFIIGFNRNKVPASQPDLALTLAEEIASYYGKEYQIVYAVHIKLESLHVHFVMNAVNYMTGNRYEGKKKDLYAFMKHCRGVFKKHSIDDYIELVSKQVPLSAK